MATKAKVIAAYGPGFWIVRNAEEGGDKFYHLTHQQAPGASIGVLGTLSYRVGPSYGLHFFDATRCGRCGEVLTGADALAEVPGDGLVHADEVCTGEEVS